jgi:hypothetical protein
MQWKETGFGGNRGYSNLAQQVLLPGIRSVCRKSAEYPRCSLLQYSFPARNPVFKYFPIQSIENRCSLFKIMQIV